MPKKNPWFKCYPVDFLNGVADLSPNEIAVYTVVLMRMYDEDGPVVDDTARIAHRCNMRIPTCKKAIDSLCAADKFAREDGLLVNGKAQEVIENRRGTRAKQQRNAQARWKKEREKNNENNEGAMPPHCQTDANSMPTRSKKLDTRKKEGRKSAQSAPPDSKYAFEGKTVRLTHSDYERWQKMCPMLSKHNLFDTTLQNRDDWFRDETDATRKDWFVRTSNYLRNKEIEVRKNPPVQRDEHGQEQTPGRGGKLSVDELRKEGLIV